MENTTRIADLPDSSTGNINADGISSNYTPINVHPNPYGVSAQNPIMPNPIQTSAPQNQLQQQVMPPPQSQYLTTDQQIALQNMPQQRLPSRDIAQDTTMYSQDDQIRANYIPKSSNTTDFVDEYEKTRQENIIEYEKKKKQQSHFDFIMTELQTPLFIIVLFFFFQLPIVNKLIFKQLAFLPIYGDDGNFNFNGLVLKSTLFGLLYFLVSKFIGFLDAF